MHVSANVDSCFHILRKRGCSPDYVLCNFLHFTLIFFLYYIMSHYITHSQLIDFNWTFNLKIEFIHTLYGQAMRIKMLHKTNLELQVLQKIKFGHV